jgi:hypothetical protein
VQAADYYSCMDCYPNADLSLWNGDAFAADFDELIAKPAKHATEVLQNNFYLTRMITRISPAEMTKTRCSASGPSRCPTSRTSSPPPA